MPVTPRKPKHQYECTIYNGRLKIRIDGNLFLSFTQLDFKGLYAYKDDKDVYGIDIYLISLDGGHHTMEVYFKTKQLWLDTLRILDENT